MDACCYSGRVPPDEEAHVPFREDRWVMRPWFRLLRLLATAWPLVHAWHCEAAVFAPCLVLCPAEQEQPTVDACLLRPTRRWGEHLTTPYKLQAPSLVPLGPGVWHLAKDAAWGKMWVDGRCAAAACSSGSPSIFVAGVPPTGARRLVCI